MTPTPRRRHRVGILDQMNAPFRAALSPCVGICALDDDGYCQGCLRTSAEISHWPRMDDDERLRLMEMVLPRRESDRR